MNTTIFLIRHGEPVYSYNERGERLIYGADAELSQIGRNQVQTLCRRMKSYGRGVDIVYTSPFARALQSAKIVSSEFGVSYVEYEELSDIRASKAWIGRTMEELAAVHGDGYQEAGDRESLEELARRIKGASDKIVRENEGQNVAIVGHGDPIRVLIYQLEHPGEPIPPMRELSGDDYLDFAQAWVFNLDHQLRLIERSLIFRGDEDYLTDGKPPSKLERRF